MAEQRNPITGCIDSITDKTPETLRRREAARVRRAVQEAYCWIPPALYHKVWSQQGPLTEEERQVFLKCGDVLSRVIAYPDSATADDIHEACAWPPPDVVRANIQRATDGALSTPTELYAKARDALDRDEFDARISDEEALLIVDGFYARDDDSRWRIMAPHAVPGFGHALTLLSRRLGLSESVFKAAWTRRWEITKPAASGRPQPPPAPVAAATPQDEWKTPGERLGALTTTAEAFKRGEMSEQDFLARMGRIQAAISASLPPRPRPATPMPEPVGLASGAYSAFGPCEPMLPTDWSNPAVWPSGTGPADPLWLFMDDTGLAGAGVVPGWSILPEAQKQAYRDKSEALRREEWARFEQRLLAPPRVEAPGVPPALAADANANAPFFLFGFGLFRDELAAGGEGELGFWEVLARWEALSREQRSRHDDKAWQANMAASDQALAAARAAMVADWDSKSSEEAGPDHVVININI